jgi:hypothetical protein
MTPGKNAGRKQKSPATRSAKPGARARKPAKPAGDPNSPGMRLRRFIEQALRDDRSMAMPELLAATNEWAKQGHTHMGYKLWPGDRPFGPPYLGLLLREDWAAKLASPELRAQARFFRENPDKDLDDLARVTRARLEALRERSAREQAEKRERKKQADAARAERERAERQQRERERKEREQRDADEARARRGRALQYIVDFFAAADIAASIDGQAVRVAGVSVSPSKAQVASQGKLDELIDSVVWEHHRDALLKSISRNLRGVHELRAVAGTHGWVLSHSRVAVAVIRATSAKVPAMSARRGNYLTDRNGAWDLLAQEIQIPTVDDLPTPALPKRRVFTEFPEGLPADIRELAHDATAELRTRRNLVFGHSVELQYAQGAIRFAPLLQDGTHIEAPITWSRWTKGAQARLRLAGKQDPLNLVFQGDDEDGAVVAGWALALVAYAQLVCREDLAELVRPQTRWTPPRVQRLGRPTRQFAPSTSGTAQSAWTFKPIGRTRAWIASYVAGHRRRLRPGHHASSEARARARRVGITLREGETWVSPHVRGVPADAVLQFQWEAPLALRQP